MQSEVVGMVRTQVQFTEDQHRRLKAEAHERRVSLSSVVRERMDRSFAEEASDKRAKAEAAWKAFIGCANDSATDVAENHDKYLAEIYLEDRH
jgi:hypothetical protein